MHPPQHWAMGRYFSFITPHLLMTISLTEFNILSLYLNTAQTSPRKKVITSYPPPLLLSQHRSKFIFCSTHPLIFHPPIKLVCFLGQVSQIVCPPLQLLESFPLTKDTEECCHSKQSTHGSTGQKLSRVEPTVWTHRSLSHKLTHKG